MRERRRQAVDDSNQAISEGEITKIDEETDRASDEPQICEQLRPVNLLQRLDRFDLDRDSRLDEEVESETASEVKAVEIELDTLLPLDLQPTPAQFSGEYSLIHRFQQPWPDLPMNLQGRVHDIGSDVIKRFHDV